MSIHSLALKKACDDLNFSYRSIGKTDIFLAVKIKDRDYHFIANQVPLNNSITSAIVEDKGHSYDLLKDVITIPQTLSFLDPNVRELYQPFVKQKSLEEIVSAYEKVFSYPVIIKKNTGSQGTHVFKCSNTEESLQALREIFNHFSEEYDHVALVQECVKIAQEFRVTVLDKKIAIVYLKDNSMATYTGNLSPLHWEGAEAVLINDNLLKEQIGQFIEPIYSLLNLEYGGLDIAKDKNGRLWLLEINSHPAYDNLVKSTNDQVLVDLYKKMLTYLAEKAE